jgi:2-polyprenyl-6-methoxyphenol hydroxylase-like FAD-dependent oxidoreductase
VRKWAGFSERQDEGRLLLCGLFMENSKAPEDTVRLVNDLGAGRASIIFPLGKGRARTYLAYGVGEGIRLQGDKDVPQFTESSIATGMPVEYFAGAEAAGPLASFDGADCWVDHPYKNGVALIGDAAASSDPSWGQGLSLTLRDVRVLRDALLANDDWDAAGNAYAAEHDRYFGITHQVEDWLTTFFFDTSPEGEARRNRAFPLIAQDPSRVPDAIVSGPDQPVDETTRRRFFGEE